MYIYVVGVWYAWLAECLSVCRTSHCPSTHPEICWAKNVKGKIKTMLHTSLQVYIIVFAHFNRLMWNFILLNAAICNQCEPKKGGVHKNENVWIKKIQKYM